ncbi:DUF2339 domain-containing protein [Albidovulum sp.]|uniref:DUF2339 domain-containing protein n=1 Tax=Albidovulum sp. TaxID=1872424 RepID=UPI0039B89FC6
MGFEGLFVLAALVALALPVAVVVLLVAVGGLKRRVETLEQRVAEQGRALGDLRQATRARAEVPQAAAPAPAVTLPEAMPAAEAPAAPEVPVAPEPAAAAAEAISGPWANLPPSPAPPSPPPPMPVAAPRVSALADWLKANWVFAVSALSLALAGIFFVQYGIENGLLPPTARVAAAILFGILLIAAGELVRRRWGDRETDPGAYVPSTFSGAGIVSIFGGVVAARQLYGLIGPETAFAGIVATALLAITLGWFHGAFLAAVGLLGAAAAPFIVGGESQTPWWLYGYFAVIAGTGLLVDTIRRWAWVSVLAVVLGIVGGGLVLAQTGGPGWFALMLVAIAVLAIVVPARALMPDHAGTMMVEFFAWKAQPPIFPTKLAGGTVAAASLLLLLLDTSTAAESLLVYLCLAALALALTFWSPGARALSDLTVLPAAAFLARLGFEGLDAGPLAADLAAKAIVLRAPETAAPMIVTFLLAMATAITLGAARTSGGAGRLKPFWAAGAALVAPLAALVLELFWAPSAALGPFLWALHVIALAALTAVLALAFARADGGDMRRAAYMTLSMLSLIALALFLILTKGALTLALAALVIVAAALDRRFRLPEMGVFIQAGVIALSWRLVVDPGLGWAVDQAALWEAVASCAGAAAAMAAALTLLKGLDRRPAQVVLESAFAAYAALFANVLVSRWLSDRAGGDWFFAHWALTLNALPWLILMLVQLYRLQLGGVLRWLRWAIASLAALAGFGGIALAATVANPLVALTGRREGLVYGPPLLDTLFVAYAVPGGLLLLALTRLDHVPRLIRWALMAAGVALSALYAGLEIRRLMRGDDLSVPGVTQGELYAYTLALMAVGAGLLYQAIARRSPPLRRAAMAVIGLTIAKVFLIDISGLSGLTRVFSFLALGLSLAGLAWLNRWAAARQDTGEPGSREG